MKFCPHHAMPIILNNVHYLSHNL